jgi:hypothetical protein
MSGFKRLRGDDLEHLVLCNPLPCESGRNLFCTLPRDIRAVVFVWAVTEEFDPDEPEDCCDGYGPYNPIHDDVCWIVRVSTLRLVCKDWRQLCNLDKTLGRVWCRRFFGESRAADYPVVPVQPLSVPLSFLEVLEVDTSGGRVFKHDELMQMLKHLIAPKPPDLEALEERFLRTVVGICTCLGSRPANSVW